MEITTKDLNGLVEGLKLVLDFCEKHEESLNKTDLDIKKVISEIQDKMSTSFFYPDSIIKINVVNSRKEQELGVKLVKKFVENRIKDYNDLINKGE